MVLFNKVISTENYTLTTVKHAENYGESNSWNLIQAPVSLVPNNCSFPSNVIQIGEKVDEEKHSEYSNQQLNEKLKNDLASLTNKSLMVEYKSEYSAWKNSKNRAKKMKGIKGTKFDAKFNSFPSFLKLVGPKPQPDYSLDRIDSEYGYTEENVRWASKQLQSENRKIVQEYEVDGKPMTLTKIADLIGINYDALRMQLKRGRTMAEILAKYHSSKSVTAKPKKSVSECPWPHGKEVEWEENFKKEASSLCPRTPKSRCQYYLAKCNQFLEQMKSEAYEFGDEPLPVDLIKLTEYWLELREDAAKKLEMAIQNERARPSLGPSKEELEMREVLGL